MGKEQPKYFSNFWPEGMNEITQEDLFRNPDILRTADLIDFLRLAREKLTTEPGPNLARRKSYVPVWLNYWEDILRRGRVFGEFDYLWQGQRVLPFEQAPNVLSNVKRHIETGALFCAGFEGHEGHRFAVEYMAKYTFPVIVFEPDENFDKLGKSREKPFLPLAIRLKMWSFHPKVGLITVVPSYPEPFDYNFEPFYQKVFERMGADRCFADECDPNCDLKVRRGKYYPENVIRHLPVVSTTDRVQKLMPDVGGVSEVYPVDVLLETATQPVCLEESLHAF